MYIRIIISVPCGYEKIIKAAMLEDSEISGGYTRYNNCSAEIYVECKKLSSCFVTIDDRLRCLTMTLKILERIKT